MFSQKIGNPCCRGNTFTAGLVQLNQLVHNLDLFCCNAETEHRTISKLQQMACTCSAQAGNTTHVSCAASMPLSIRHGNAEAIYLIISECIFLERFLCDARGFLQQQNDYVWNWKLAMTGTVLKDLE